MNHTFSIQKFRRHRVPNKDLGTEDNFSLTIIYTHFFRIYTGDDDDESSPAEERKSMLIEVFVLEKAEEGKPVISQDAVSRMLSSFGIPTEHHSDMAHRIVSRIIAPDAAPGRFHIRFGVHVMGGTVVPAAWEKAGRDFVKRMEGEWSRSRMVPVSGSAAEEEEGGGEDCAICMEEVKGVGGNWSRMPCSHVFHAVCVLQWLKKSQSCPLCRLEIPI